MVEGGISSAVRTPTKRTPSPLVRGSSPMVVAGGRDPGSTAGTMVGAMA